MFLRIRRGILLCRGCLARLCRTRLSNVYRLAILRGVPERRTRTVPAEPNRLIGLDLLHLERGQSYARLTISRNLSSGKVDDVPLSRRQLVTLIRDAAKALDILDDRP